MKEPRRIQKDEEWLRLEAKVDELRSTLYAAETELAAYSRNFIAAKLGITPHETVVLNHGDRYVVDRVEPHVFEPWVYGRKVRKDGTPSERVSALYSNWEIETI